MTNRKSHSRNFAPRLWALFSALFATVMRLTAMSQTNTFYGIGAVTMTTGLDNSGFGYNALHFNTSGGANTAIGSMALYKNQTGSSNTAVGYAALYDNTSGSESGWPIPQA